MNYLILLSSLFSSCSSDNNEPFIDLPSDLSIEIIVEEDGSGKIEIIAQANNTVEFQFDTGEANNDIITNNTGVASYTYSVTGVYEVEVRAVGSSGRYIRKSQQINVQVGDSEIPIDTENGYSTPLSYEGMTMIWQDEFEGSSLNESDWNYEIGTGSNGWGNNELQYYRKENTSLNDGLLTIEAKKESFSGQDYTSSRLTTQNKFSFKYGRVDIRAVLPNGQGIWPALWMLGDNISTVGWPKCGETDIMEMIGGGPGRDDTTYGTLHWDNNGDYACTCDQNNDYKLSSGIFTDKFHVFTIIWDANSIQWFVDDTHFKTAEITPAELSEFHSKFFFIFNVAVGGNWPGSPNSSTVLPQKMIVDYIRVFQKN